MYVKCDAPKNATKCKKRELKPEKVKEKVEKPEKELKMKTVELKVTGMKCVHCEANVAKALEKVEGVEKAIADRTHDRVLIRLTGEEVDENAIKSALAELEGKTYEGIVE